MEKNKRMQFYGGTLGACAPLLVFMCLMIVIAAMKKVSLVLFCMAGFAGLCVAFLLAKNKKEFEQAVADGLNIDTRGVIIFAFLLAGILSQELRQSGLIQGLTWLVMKLGLSAGFLPLVAFLVCLLISTACGTSNGAIVAVLPVLLLNTLFSSLLFLPTILSTAGGWGWFDATPLRCPAGDLHAHLLVVLKSCIVLSSWVFGYFGIKHLPLTIVGPINATRPVMTLVGAMLIFGERLNGYQWVGVVLAIGSLFLLSRSSRREGVDFRHDGWIYCIAAAAVLGAASGLYDKFITRRLDPVFVQSWYTFYQFWMMSAAVLLIWWPRRRRTTPFHWSWAIPFISLFLSAADLCYLYALSDSEAMISVVSMIRRGSVVVSFGFGALLFRERNLRAKAIDLALILVGMVFLWIGSR